MAQFHSLLSIQEAMLARFDAVTLDERRSLKAYLWDFACREWTRCGSGAPTATHPSKGIFFVATATVALLLRLRLWLHSGFTLT